MNFTRPLNLFIDIYCVGPIICPANITRKQLTVDTCRDVHNILVV